MCRSTDVDEWMNLAAAVFAVDDVQRQRERLSHVRVPCGKPSPRKFSLRGVEMLIRFRRLSVGPHANP